MTDVSTLISRFAFVFLIYAIITSGYIVEILSCQMRTFLMTSSYARHLFAIVMVFAFIMFEGGWDFSKVEEDKAPTNWASGNTFHSLIIAIAVYGVFLVSSKSKLIPNLIFFSLLFIVYFVNTYRSYLYERKRINDDSNKTLLFIEKILAIGAICVLIYGFVEYLLYQKEEYGVKFSFLKFMLGSRKCKSVKNI